MLALEQSWSKMIVFHLIISCDLHGMIKERQILKRGLNTGIIREESEIFLWKNTYLIAIITSTNKYHKLLTDCVPEKSSMEDLLLIRKVGLSYVLIEISITLNFHSIPFRRLYWVSVRPNEMVRVNRWSTVIRVRITIVATIYFASNFQQTIAETVFGDGPIGLTKHL